MAWLERHRSSKTFHVVFRIGGKRFRQSLRTNDRREANARLVRLEENLRLVESGRLTLPQNCSAAAFLLSDGKLNGKPHLPEGLRLGETIVFTKKAALPSGEPKKVESPLIATLIGEGVTPSVAAELVSQFSEAQIRLQLEVLDRLKKARNRESLRNPAGYLVKSIREGYLPPVSLRAKISLPKPTEARKAEPPAAKDPVEEQIDKYLLSLPDDELRALEEEGLKQADATLVDGYKRSRAADGPTFTVYRRMVLERAARHKLFGTAPTASKAA